MSKMTAMLAPVPGVGAIVRASIENILNEKRFRRIEDYLPSLTQAIDGLLDKHEAYVNSKEFQELLTQNIEQASRERNEEKRQLFANLVSGAIRNEQTFDDFIELRADRTLEEFTPLEIAILVGIAREPIGPVPGKRINLLRRLAGLPDDKVDEAMIEIAVDHLERIGIIHELRVTLQTSALAPAELERYITPFGQSFMKAIGLRR